MKYDGFYASLIENASVYDLAIVAVAAWLVFCKSSKWLTCMIPYKLMLDHFKIIDVASSSVLVELNKTSVTTIESFPVAVYHVVLVFT